jgi:signal transduction histidine kinase
MNSRLHAAAARDAAWYLATAVYTAIACAWLLVGLAVAFTAHIASWHAWAVDASAGRHGSAWISTGQGLIAAAAHSYPVTGIVLDYIYSAANLLIAGVLFTLTRRTWSARLMVIGLVGTAAAFNLQVHTAVQAVSVATGVQIDGWHTALLHGAGGTAYLLALLLFPAGADVLARGVGRAAAVKVWLLVAAIVAVAAVLATLTAQYPHTLTFVLFFGLVVPLGGAAVRGQSRILLWALGGTGAAAVLLAVLALSSQALQTPGLPRDVPGISVGMPGLTGTLPGVGDIGTQVVGFWIFRLLALMIPCAVLVVTLRFRPGAVEQLLNRTLVYGGLVALAGGAYVFLVVRVDAWFGLDSDWLAPPQVAAAGLVALAFHPLRIRFERWADRLVYGRRIAPYDVLAQVSALSQTSGTGEQALLSLARIAAQGLRTGYATVYVNGNGEGGGSAGGRGSSGGGGSEGKSGARIAYTWPPGATTSDPEHEREIPVAYRGTSIGALAIPAEPGRKRAVDRAALLDHLTQAAAVVMHNAGLSLELENRLRVTERHTAEIRASRWRIVAAQDSERRELERDLHDGAQPALTAVRFSLGLAVHLAAGGNEKARGAITRLRDQIDEASVGLRQTLRGLAPAALGAHGIGLALRELAESLGTEVEFHIDDETQAARFTPEFEAAVYFCCAEALQNAAKHCPDAAVEATLRFDREHRELAFTVTDDGPGFDAAVSTGSGMQNMADRIAAVGGTLNIESAPGEGTSVSGKVPAALAADQTLVIAALAD